MNNLGGPLSFDAIIADFQFMATLSRMERRMMGFSSTAIRETNKVDESFKRLGQLAVGYLSFDFLKELPQQIVRARSQVESLSVELNT